MTENDFLSRISVDPEICGGRPCIRGTRVRVSDVVEMIAAGAPRETILEDYPYLSADDITAALIYAARVVEPLLPGALQAFADGETIVEVM